MRHFVEKEVENKKIIYRTSSNEVKSQYKIETEKMESYRGRELLELLQNADDELNEELPKEVKISFKDNILSVCNYGNPFSEEGVTSLMYSNNSGKANRKTKVIGNKGTGFRSILGWAERITINSGDLHIGFSREYAQKVLRDALGDIVEKEKLIAPTLVFPEWIDSTNEFGFTTEISIKVKENKRVIDDINEQLDSINEELLLFLNKTKKLIIEKEGKEVCFERKDLEETTIISVEENGVIKETEWKINSVEGTMIEDDEEKVFMVSTAYKTSGEKPSSNVLFCYFPTEVEFPYPILVHANFILGENRNSLLKKSDINAEILKHVAQLTVETLRQIKCAEVNYDCLYSLLMPMDYDFHSDLRNYDFEKVMLDAISEARIYPTVNKKYISMIDEPKFYESGLAKYLKGKEFEDLLIVYDEETKERYGQEYEDFSAESFTYYLIKTFPNETFNVYDYEEIVNKIALWISGIKVANKANMRKVAETAISFYDEFTAKINQGKIVPIFIFNQDGKIADADAPIFIEKEGMKFTSLPRFAHIEFMNNYQAEWFQENAYSWQLTWMNVNEVNCHNIVDGIDARISTLISDGKEKQATKFAETSLKWMWANRIVLEEEAKTDGGYDTYLINRNHIVQITSELFAGKEYNNELCEKLYCWASDDIWVCDLREYVGADIEVEEMIKFVKMLNVSFLPKQYSTRKTIWGDLERELLSELKYPFQIDAWRIESVDDWKDHGIKELSYVPTLYHDFETILEHASTITILEWIQTDKTLYSLLTTGKEIEDSSLRITFGNNRTPRSLPALKNPISYTYHLFRKAEWIEIGDERFSIRDCILDETIGDKLAPLLVYPNIDTYIKDLEGNKNRIRNDIIALFGQLSVKTSIEELPLNKIYEIFNYLPNVENSGELASTLYKEVLLSGIKYSSEFLLVDEYKKYLDEGKVYTNNGYVNNSEAFYLDGKDICEKIAHKFNLIELPRRMNRDNIEKLLGVKRLNLSAKLLREPIISQVNGRFKSDFEIFKPLAFCYRIDKKKDLENQARKFSKLEVVLCDEIYADYSKGPIYLEDFEYLLDEDGVTYYLKVPYEFNERQLKHNLDLSKAIANIISSYMDVYEDLSRYRELYYVWDKSTRESVIQEEFEDPTIIERSRRALNFNLGLKEEFISIMESLSNVEQQAYTADINNIDFNDFQSVVNLKDLQNCFKHAKLDFEDYNAANPSVLINYVSYYETLIEDLLPTYRDAYKKSKYWELKSGSLLEKIQLSRLFLEFDAISFAVKNSAYFEAREIIEETLCIKSIAKSVDLNKLYFDNLETFKLQLENTDHLEEFTCIPENQSLIYYEEFNELKNRYLSYLKDVQREQLIETSRPVKIEKIDIVMPETLPGKEQSKKSQMQKVKTTGFVQKQHSKREQERTGLSGEKYVYEQLLNNPEIKSVYWKSENAKKAKINPEGAAGLGYDIEIVDKNGKRKYIEVKASKTSKAAGIRFFMSDNEYEFACAHSKEYEIYYICGVGSEEPSIYVLKNVFEDGEFNAKNYAVTTETDYTVTADIL